MAPRWQRRKVGLTRMHAAVDAMRPMGFPADVVRKCVKKLLKVYGNDGWVFLEDSAYKLLIETILQEPEDTIHEELEDTFHEEPKNPKPEHLLSGESSHENHRQAKPVHQICGKEVTDQEQVATLDICQAEVNYKDVYLGKEVKQEQELLVDIRVQKELVGISVQKEIKQEQKLDIDELSPAPLQVGAQFSLTPPDTTPQPKDTTLMNKRHRPCYGWISNDEDEDEHEDRDDSCS